MQKLIYYVEDDQDDADLFIEAAETLGVKVHRFSTCREFLEHLAASGKPDLIFLDGSIPSCDRDDTVRAIRENDKFSHIPIIIYSGFLSATDQKKLESFENIYFKVKGFNFAAITEVIQNSIDAC